MNARSAFTLIELLVVLGLLVLLAVFVLPNFQAPLQRSYLPESGERLRSLIGMTRTHAMMDNLTYRISFLEEGDQEAENMSPDDLRQPYIELERDPIEYPGEFSRVMAAWATQGAFLGNVWCYQVTIGEPTYESVIAELEDQELADEDERREEQGIEEDQSWVLFIEPDGTSDWMTFRLIDQPRDEFNEGDLEEYLQLDVILDGRLGVVFLQRPLSDEELDILLDKGHSPILRRDFLTARSLTEDDVLEIDMNR